MPNRAPWPNVSPNSGHQGGAGRGQEEQAGDRGGRAAPDQQIEQRDRSQRQHQHQPAQGEDELARPVDPALLEGHSQGSRRRRAGHELDRRAGAQVHAAAETLLVEGPRRDAGQGDDAGQGAHPLAEAAAQLLRQDQGHARQAKRQAEPLAGHHPLAEQGPRQGRDQQRLDADDQGGQPRLHPQGDADEHPAKVHGMDQQPGDRIVGDLGPAARPGRARRQRDQGQQDARQHIAQGQEGQRPRVRQAQPRADEAGAPQDDEEGGKAEPGERRRHMVRKMGAPPERLEAPPHTTDAPPHQRADRRTMGRLSGGRTLAPHP